MAESRVVNSVRNVFAAWGGQAVSAVLSFVVRAVFVATLAREYVGLETLFASLLTILSLTDLGVGSAITFALYDPLAHDDKTTVKSLMRLFKRAYIIIGCVIIAIGAILAPNVSVLVGSDAPDIPFLELYFFCFVLNSGVSYFFSYKGALITADQKSYIVYLITYGAQAVMACVQIAVLFITKNYLIFLICMVTSTLVQNILIARKCNRMYPYILEKDVEPLDKGLFNSIVKNVVGLFMHKVAGAASTPACNLIITLFVGLSTTSLYGNYLLVVNAMDRILARVFDSIIASVGNLGASESEERQYEVFQTTFFINALVYGAVAGGMLCAFNPFIEVLTQSADWCFAWPMVALIVFLFYVKGMRSAGLTFTSAYGLYWKTKWKAVLEAVSLPGFALLLVQPLGMAGVLIGAAISSLCISTVYEAWAVYRHGFHRSLRNYIVRFVLYVVITCAACAAAFFVSSLIPLPALPAFFVRGVIGVAVPVAVLIAIFGRRREAQEAFSVARSVIGRVASRLRRK